MFRYIRYSNIEITNYGQGECSLQPGYIRAIGSPIDIHMYVDNLIEEIGKVPVGSTICIVWENDYRARNQQLWDMYTETIVPHNFKPPELDQEVARDNFDIVQRQLEMEFNECQVDFVNLHEFISPVLVDLVVAALQSRHLHVYGCYEPAYWVESNHIKSARTANA